MDIFGTAINCIDGRAQAPVADWIKLNSHVHYVDMITEPGVDKVLAEGKSAITSSIYEKTRVSIDRHQSRIVAVVGHFDCAANPVSVEEHKQMIAESVELLLTWNLGVRIAGLYVNEWSAIDLIYDSEVEFQEMKSFL